MSLITLNAVSLTLAGNVLLDNVSWTIQPQDRIALVGRNGAGKSTLLKLLQQEITTDSGSMQRQQGIVVACLAQDVTLVAEETVYACLVRGLGEAGQVLLELHNTTDVAGDDYINAQLKLDSLHGWNLAAEIESMVLHLGFDANLAMHDLSGGMKRRVLLASALLMRPDVLLLDEPTNHLDIKAIEWLESYLATYPGSVIMVTHDRAFLERVATQIVELDRGKLHTYACNYKTYLERRDARLQTEATANSLFDKQLREEEIWLRTGVKARRTRNEGRVRALKSMREEYKQRLVRQSSVKTMQLDVKRSGSLVIEAQDLAYDINGKVLLQDFSCLLSRGDKIGIIGANGCGKTTLIRLLLGELTASAGTIRHGTSLNVAYFDQLRCQLEDNKTVMANVADGSDHVTINGKSKHVSAYLQDFLFDKTKLNQPVTVLSGGERQRLLLAKLLARPVNVLVMDEPTNDLDIETLELLEELLVEYTGTLLLISHDRAFVNNVVTRIWVNEAPGLFNEYVGGYDTYLTQRKTEAPVVLKTPGSHESKDVKSTVTLSFNEQRELAKIPQQIQKLEKKQAQLEAKLAAIDFYQQPADMQAAVNAEYKNIQHSINILFERWDKLES